MGVHINRGHQNDADRVGRKKLSYERRETTFWMHEWKLIQSDLIQLWMSEITLPNLITVVNVADFDFLVINLFTENRMFQRGMFYQVNCLRENQFEINRV